MTAIFNDNMKLTDVVFDNKGYRILMADIFALQALALEQNRSYDNLQSLDLNKKFYNPPLLKEVKYTPCYRYRYFDKKGEMNFRFISLDKITEEQKAQSMVVLEEAVKQKFKSIPNRIPSELEIWKEADNRYQENAKLGLDLAVNSLIDPKSNRYFLSDFANSIEELPLPMSKLNAYIKGAFNEVNARKVVIDLLKKGVMFYKTQDTGVYEPQVDNLVENHWSDNVKDVHWKTYFNKFLNEAKNNNYYSRFKDLKVKDIKDQLDWEETSLIKFQSFMAQLSEYKSQVKIDVSGLSNEQPSIEQPSVKQPSTKQPSTKQPSVKQPVVNVENSLVVSTAGIQNLLFKTLRPYISRVEFSTDLFGNKVERSPIPSFDYELSGDKKEIKFFIINLETPSNMNEAQFKGVIERAISAKTWSRLISVDLKIHAGPISDWELYLFDLEIRIKLTTTNYIFHEQNSTIKVDIETKDPTTPSSLKMPRWFNTPTVELEKLIPPAHLSIEDKIKFVLQFRPDSGTCGYCKGQFALKKNGLLFSHGFTVATEQWWRQKNKSSECDGTGTLPVEFSVETILFEVERLRLLVSKMDRDPSAFTQEQLLNKDKLKKDLQQSELIEKNWKFRFYNPNTGMWMGANYPISSGNMEYITDDLTSKVTDTIIKLGNFKVIFTDKLTIEQLEDIQKAFTKAVKLIKQSPLKDFKKILRGRVFVGAVRTLRQRLISKGELNVSAFYESQKGYICYHMDSIQTTKLTVNQIVADLIHEFGHKFHNEELKGFMENPALIALYKSTKQEDCVKAGLPQIGDPLKDYLVDWSVKLSAKDDYKLFKVDGKKYLFRNSKGDIKTYDEEDLITTIVCPSEYGAQDVMEFFAEMCVAVTAGISRKPQQEIIKKFIKIVNENVL